MLDTMDKETTAADIRVLIDGFDANDFLVEGSENIFRQYTNPIIHKVQSAPLAGETVLYVMASTASRQGINKSGQVGEIVITPKNLGELKLQFAMIPGKDTDDSNVAVLENGEFVDGLQSVENLTLNVVEGDCPGAVSLVPLTEESTANAEVVIIENDNYVPQFAAAERRDRLLNTYHTNKSTIWFVGGGILLLLIIAVVYATTRKKKHTS